MNIRKFEDTKEVIRSRFGQYHFYWSVPRPLGSLYILILPSISVTFI